MYLNERCQGLVTPDSEKKTLKKTIHLVELSGSVRPSDAGTDEWRKAIA
jgi:hypothetical protein